MLGLTETAAAVSSLKAAMDIAKGIQALGTDAKIKLATIDLMEKILAAQQDAFAAHEAQSDLLRRIAELEAEAAQLKRWSDEKSRYQLNECPTGVLVYSLKPEASNGEPEHHICPTCYQDAQKSILQSIGRVRGGEVVDCPKCKLRLEFKESDPIPNRGGGGSNYF